MKICSACDEIVSENQSCDRLNCPVRKEGVVDPTPMTEPGFTGRTDKVVQTKLDGAGEQARKVTRKAALALTAVVLASALGVGIYYLIDGQDSPWDYSKIDLDIGPDGIVTQLDDSKMHSVGFEGIQINQAGPKTSLDIITGNWEDKPVYGELILSKSDDCDDVIFKINSQKFNKLEKDVIDSKEIKYSTDTLGIRYIIDAESEVILNAKNDGPKTCKFFSINRKLSSTQWAQDETVATEQMSKLGAISKATVGWTYRAEGLESRLASAYDARGQSAFAKCAACHTVNQGGMNGIGPNLYGIVGRDIATKGDFPYSQGLSGKSGKWDFANLDRWLARPNDFATGTKMTFAGLSNPQERADIIVYLNLQGSLQPLPEIPSE